MVIDYKNKYEELFSKVYIYGNANDKKKEIYIKLSEWMKVELADCEYLEGKLRGEDC